MSEYTVLRVKGLGWRAVAGLGWGSRIAPVLALLERVGGLERAEVDRSGTTLRIHPRDVVGEVRSRLVAAGVETEVLDAIPGDATEWFDRDRAAELSRKEARVLSSELAETFAARESLTAAVEEQLRSLLAARLERALAESDLPSLRSRLARCADEVAGTAADALGDRRERFVRHVRDRFDIP